MESRGPAASRAASSSAHLTSTTSGASNVGGRAGDPWTHAKAIIPGRDSVAGLRENLDFGASKRSWFSDSFHSSFRDSAWSTIPPLEKTPRSAKQVNEAFAGGLRSSSPGGSRRGGSPRRPRAASPRAPARSSSTGNEARPSSSRFIVTSRGGGAHVPRLFQDEQPPLGARAGGEKPQHQEWQVPAFKGNIAHIHSSRRHIVSAEFRSEREYD
jgi:hypothetical protein